jgi:hypothetical protein
MRALLEGIVSYLEDDRESLLACLGVCRKWLRILKSRYLSDWAILIEQYTSLLYYDEGIYDAHHYTRLILRQEYRELRSAYPRLSIPQLFRELSDLVDDEWMVMVVPALLPLDVRAFMHTYLQRTHHLLRLYPPGYLGEIAAAQSSYLRKRLSGENSSLQGLVLYYPICYSSYSPNDDTSRVQVVCYANVIDEELEREYPPSQERYLNITLNLPSSDWKTHSQELPKFLQELTEHRADQTGNMQSLPNALELILFV